MIKASSARKLILCAAALSSLSFASACAPLGIAAVGAAGAGTSVAAARDGGIPETVSDGKIALQINDLWFKYDTEMFSKVNLTVDQGRVLLTGNVQDPDHRVEAVRLAWHADGVRQVINEVRIEDAASFSEYVTDRWITTRLRTAIMFDEEVHSINYTIDTVKGVVYLMGTARDRKELTKVMTTAQSIPHVKNVISYVKMIGRGVPVMDPVGENG